MGYRVIKTDPETFDGYQPRKDLEGPFRFANELVVYYDPKEGKYYNPSSDFYLSDEEAIAMNIRKWD